MKARTLLTLGILSVAPSLFAQVPPEPLEAVAAPAPAPKAALARRATVASVPEIPARPEAPHLPSSPEMPQTPKVAPAPVPAAPAAPAPAPAAAPAAPVPPRPVGQMINVRIEVTLTDSKGAKKMLTMTVADGESGMNRTANAGPMNFSFNADARPIVVGNKIKLQLTADAAVPVDGEKGGTLGLRQSQTVILNDGDSVEIARAADPVSDRTFVLSVAVKIQR